MTDDIVERLRHMGWTPCLEGADEIERLRAELAAEREQFHDGVLCHSAETLKLTAERDAAVARAEKAEAERDALRAELANAYALNGAVSESLYQTTADRDALRALLREAREELRQEGSASLLDSINAALKGGADE